MLSRRLVAVTVTASMMGVLIGPAGAAFAAGSEPELGLASSESQTPDVLEALDVVPGLEGAGDPTSTAEVLDSSMGFAVEGSSGSSTTIERVDASGSSTAAYSEAGETVVEESSTDTDTVVQQLPDGARVLEVIGSSDAPQAFSYRVDVPTGMEILPQEDGSLLIGTTSQVGDTVSLDVDGVIGAPWAIDANGQPVAASYQVDNGVVTMRVEHSDDVAYPVVADPTYTGGGFRVTWSIWNPAAVTIYLNKARTSDAEDFGAAICIGIGFVPVVGPVLAALCGLHNIAIRATSRYGYCQYWKANIVTRRFEVLLYRGGFCV